MSPSPATAAEGFHRCPTTDSPRIVVCLVGKLIPSAAATATSAVRQKPCSAAIAVGERYDWDQSGPSLSTGKR